MAENTEPGTFITSICIGDTWQEDKFNSVFYSADDMVAEACQFIKEQPELQDGYHAVGWSQVKKLIKSQYRSLKFLLLGWPILSWGCGEVSGTADAQLGDDGRRAPGHLWHS